MSYRIPVTHLLCRENIAVVHTAFGALVQMVIHVVAYEEIRYVIFKLRSSTPAELLHPCQQFPVCIPVKPVIRVYYFIVNAPGKLKSFVDS